MLSGISYAGKSNLAKFLKDLIEPDADEEYEDIINNSGEVIGSKKIHEDTVEIVSSNSVLWVLRSYRRKEDDPILFRAYTKCGIYVEDDEMKEYKNKVIAGYIK